MNSNQLTKLAGVILILSGILFIVGILIHPSEENSAAMLMKNWVPAHVLLYISCVFAMAGFIGAYDRQAEKSKGIGLLGFILVFIGFALLTGVTFTAAFLGPIISAQAPTIIDNMSPNSAPAMLDLWSAIIVGIGGIVFGISSLKAKVYSKTSGILLILGGLGLLLGFTVIPGILGLVGVVLFGAGEIFLGNRLRKK